MCLNARKLSRPIAMVPIRPVGPIGRDVSVNKDNAPIPHQDTLLEDIAMNYIERNTNGMYDIPTNGGPGVELMGADARHAHDWQTL
jgi:hypothetical protein